MTKVLGLNSSKVKHQQSSVLPPPPNDIPRNNRNSKNKNRNKPPVGRTVPPQGRGQPNSHVHVGFHVHCPTH